jgi:pyrimidine operon attenuation protein/uracil phosphoribosyltransferase
MEEPAECKQLLAADDIRRTFVRMAHEIVERNPALETVTLVGIRTRGAYVAERLGEMLRDIAGVDVPVDSIDITAYRDDGGGKRFFSEIDSVIAAPVDDRSVIVCDDVLYTGRTVRAAIEAVFAQGRPARVQLAALIDRGHRELPFRPDYIGKNLPTAPGQWIRVELAERDDVDRVLLHTSNSAMTGTVRSRELHATASSDFH